MLDKRVFTLPKSLIRKYHTRDPFEIAEALGIEVVMCPEFKRQKGVFTVILRNCLILINANLSEEMQRIVCAHELGHALLHRKMATASGGLMEFELFDINDQL